jgi:hypothetical protein
MISFLPLTDYGIKQSRMTLLLGMFTLPEALNEYAGVDDHQKTIHAETQGDRSVFPTTRGDV